MENAEFDFLSSLRDLSTAKEKIFEISSTMILHQRNDSKILVSLWLKEFQSLKEEKKRLAMLYIMNDVLLKSTKDARGQEYLKEFSSVIPEVISNLIAFKDDLLLEEFRKIVMIWEKPGNQLFVSAYTNQLKAKVQEAIDAVQDDRFGSSVINEFELTKRLKDLEIKHEAHLDLAKEIYLQFNHRSPDFLSEAKETMSKCENELVERSMLLIDLAKMLENEIQKYKSSLTSEV